jgi:hypothetical protein
MTLEGKSDTIDPGRDNVHGKVDQSTKQDVRAGLLRLQKRVARWRKLAHGNWMSEQARHPTHSE